MEGRCGTARSIYCLVALKTRLRQLGGDTTTLIGEGNRTAEREFVLISILCLYFAGISLPLGGSFAYHWLLTSTPLFNYPVTSQSVE